MSYQGQPGGFGLNGKSLYSNVAKPIDINLQWVVTPTNGLGVTSLKSNGYVNNVFMHTSTTPTANNGFTNPNPASGYAWIQLKNNLNVYLNSMGSFVAKNSGSDVKIDNSAMTVGQPYVITTLGNATLAKWQAIGVPVGVTPAVGVSFIALSNGGAGNTLTSRVQVPSVSGISHIEMVGTASTMVNSSVGANAGQWIMVQFLAASFTGESYTPAGTISAPVLTMNSYTPAGTNNSATPPIFTGTPAVLTGTNSAPTFTGTAHTLTGTMSYVVTAPAASSIVCLKLAFDGSSVTVDGL